MTLMVMSTYSAYVVDQGEIKYSGCANQGKSRYGTFAKLRFSQNETLSCKSPWSQGKCSFGRVKIEG
jgi:hypothetical protein